MTSSLHRMTSSLHLLMLSLHVLTSSLRLLTKILHVLTPTLHALTDFLSMLLQSLHVRTRFLHLRTASSSLCYSGVQTGATAMAVRTARGSGWDFRHPALSSRHHPPATAGGSDLSRSAAFAFECTPLSKKA